MVVNYLELPYQFDVTYITPVINLVVNKIIELASEYMVVLPPDVRPYDEIDLAEIADVMRSVSNWQATVVSAIGLSPLLVPKIYEQVDYNSIGSMATYYEGTMNAIIDAANNQTQHLQESYNGELQ